MLTLGTTTQTLEALLGGAAATTNPPAVVSYAEHTATTYTGKVQHTDLNGTTAVTILSAPASSTEHVVRGVAISNIDTAAVTLTVRFKAGVGLKMARSMSVSQKAMSSLPQARSRPACQHYRKTPQTLKS